MTRFYIVFICTGFFCGLLMTDSPNSGVWGAVLGGCLALALDLIFSE